MSWEEIGAVAEIVGALGVIVTLGYLAVQIRENSKQVHSNFVVAIINGYATALAHYRNGVLEDDDFVASLDG